MVLVSAILSLRSVSDLYRERQRITARGIVLARRAREQSTDRLLAVLLGLQAAMVEETADATPGVLAEQGIRDDAVAAVNVRALLGWASDGRPLASLVTIPDLTNDQFDRIVQTQLQDVARQADAIERAVRPQVTHYVRALNLPSCGRCVVLAGKPERREVAFRRHPRCDCASVPTDARNAPGLVTTQDEAWAGMDQAEREKAFTKAGAEAIRLGANVNRVVNARRGMYTAQGRSLIGVGVQRRLRADGSRAESASLVTNYWSAGRLRRNADGVFGTSELMGSPRSRRAMGLARGDVRLMPESIMELADTDQARIDLLRRFGYITD